MTSESQQLIINKLLTETPSKAIRVRNSKEARRLLSSIIYQMQKGTCSNEHAKTVAYLLGKFIEIDKYIKSEEEISEKTVQFLLGVRAVVQTHIDFIITSLQEVLGDEAEKFMDIIEGKNTELQKAINEEFNGLIKQLAQKKVNVEQIIKDSSNEEYYKTVKLLAMNLSSADKSILINDLEKQIQS